MVSFSKNEFNCLQAKSMEKLRFFKFALKIIVFLIVQQTNYISIAYFLKATIKKVIPLFEDFVR